MKRRGLLPGALAWLPLGLPAAARATEPAQWQVEARWVRLAVPAQATSPEGTRHWSTRRPDDAIEPLGPAWRLGLGDEATWSVPRPEGTLAWVSAGAVRVPIPLAPPAPADGAPVPQSLWVRLESATALVLRLNLRWNGVTSDGADASLTRTLSLPPGRWTPVLRHDDPPPRANAPGEWRSRAAAPWVSRELQLRLTPPPP